jgi:hypothetical protein
MWVTERLVEKTEVRNREEKGIEKIKIVAGDQKDKGAKKKETATSNIGKKIC